MSLEDVSTSDHIKSCFIITSLGLGFALYVVFKKIGLSVAVILIKSTNSPPGFEDIII